MFTSSVRIVVSRHFAVIPYIYERLVGFWSMLSESFFFLLLVVHYLYVYRMVGTIACTFDGGKAKWK